MCCVPRISISVDGNAPPTDLELESVEAQAPSAGATLPNGECLSKYPLYRAYIGISHRGTLVAVHPTIP